MASQQLAGRSTTTVGVFLDAGARYETAEKSGVFNLIQRLLYKGTTSRSQADIENEVINMGASLRAFTERERTGFYATCLNEDVPKLVELLADVTQNPRFDASDVEKEKLRVIASMGEIENNLKEVVMDNLHAAAYQETPLEKNILGALEAVESIRPDDLHYFLKKYFKPHNTVIASAGGTSHNQLAELVDKHFAKVDNTIDGAPVEWTPCRYTGAEVRWRQDDLPYAHFAIGVQGPEAGSADTAKLMTTLSAIGSYCRTQGKNPEFFGSLYGERIVFFFSVWSFSIVSLMEFVFFVHYFVFIRLLVDECHSFEPFVYQYHGTGLFGIYAVSERMQIDEMSTNIPKRLRSLVHSISEAELDAAQKNAFTKYLNRIDGR